MNIDDDPTVVLPGTVRPVERKPGEGKGWDAVVEHPNGDQTFVLNPTPNSPNGFKLTVPAQAGHKSRRRDKGPAEEAVDFAVDMVFVWWGLVAVLFVVFFFAEVGFEVLLLIAAYGGMGYGVWGWVSRWRRRRRAGI